MADNTVTTKFVADPRDEVVLQLLKQQKETTNLQKKMLSLSQTSARGAKDVESGFGKVTGRLTTMVSGYIGVTAAVGGWIAANRKLIQQGDQISRTYDAVARKFQVQAGLKGLDSDNAKKSIGEIGAKRGFGFEDSFAASTQLVSSGFSAKEASGASLTEFLKLQNATNAAGATFDPQRLAAAQAGFLSASGLQLNSKNLQRSGRAFQGLFKSRNILPADLEALSGVAPALGALDVEEKLGTFAELRQGNLAPSVAATGLKTVVDSLQTANETPRVKRALKKAGIDTDEVDLVGENITEVIDRLAGAANGLPENQRAGFFKNVFGREGSAAAQLLVKRRDELKQGVSLARSPTGFKNDLKLSESGGDFLLRKQEAEEKLRRTAAGTTGQVTRGELMKRLEEDDIPPAFRDASGFVFDSARYFGASPETAANIASGGGPAGDVANARTRAAQAVDASVGEEIIVQRGKRDGDSASPASSNEVRELTNAMRETTSAIKGQNKKPQPVEVMNEPQRRGKPAAAALSK